MTTEIERTVTRELRAAAAALPMDPDLERRLELLAEEPGRQANRTRAVPLHDWLRAGAVGVVVIGAVVSTLVLQPSHGMHRTPVAARPSATPHESATGAAESASTASPTALPTTPSKATAGTPRVTSWALVSANGTDLVIRVIVGGSCEKLDHVRVTESADSVTLTAIILGGLHSACTDNLGFVTGTIQLRQPLGQRILQHGTTL